ncbi:MAG: aminoacyl-tRNA hydrolase [Candidatus Magasanikbacteria bacterium]
MTQFKPREVQIAIGLGNPGRRYRRTYHNVGQRCIKLLNEEFPKLKTRIDLIQSEGFMNESGSFVNKKLQEYSSSPKELLVIHDDSDITLGDYKFSFSRGSAGHKGIKSIKKSLNTKEFWRARIGIRKENENRKAEEFVLDTIGRKEEEILKKVFREIGKELIP